MTPVEACARRARVIRCYDRMIARRSRRIETIRSQALISFAYIERACREFEDHERRMAMLREHFDGLAEIALRGGALLH